MPGRQKFELAFLFYSRSASSQAIVPRGNVTAGGKGAHRESEYARISLYEFM